jgi:hypothetical protein
MYLARYTKTLIIHHFLQSWSGGSLQSWSRVGSKFEMFENLIKFFCDFLKFCEIPSSSGSRENDHFEKNRDQKLHENGLVFME